MAQRCTHFSVRYGLWCRHRHSVQQTFMSRGHQETGGNFHLVAVGETNDASTNLVPSTAAGFPNSGLPSSEGRCKRSWEAGRVLLKRLDPACKAWCGASGWCPSMTWHLAGWLWAKIRTAHLRVESGWSPKTSKADTVRKLAAAWRWLQHRLRKSSQNLAASRQDGPLPMEPCPDLPAAGRPRSV